MQKYLDTSQHPTTKMYTLRFWQLCASTVLFFASFSMIVPELPNYLSSMGGGEYKGLIIALFTVTAGLSRPFSGKLADTVGRVPVMVFGAVVCFLSSLIYPLADTVFLFLSLRLLHGFSTGFTPTGTTAYLADIVPDNRRGEALGLLGFSTSVGTASGPALGSAVANAFSLDVMFYTAACFSLLSLLVLGNMRETLPDRQAFRWSRLRMQKEDFFEKRVLAPSLAMLLCIFSFGAMLTIIPDFSEHLGVENKGLFFTFLTIASMSVRILSGKAADRFGRIVVLKISIVILVVGLGLLGFADSAVMLMLCAFLIGLGVGLNSPAIFAWAIDLSHPAFRGRSMSTLYVALEVGIGSGALISAWIYNNQSANFPLVFMTCAALCLIALIFLSVQKHETHYQE